MVDGVEWFMRCSVRGVPVGVTPVVLVHGYLVSSRYMVPTAEVLSVDFPVYAPDLPGFGRSGEPSSLLDVNGLADALAAWMKVVGLDNAIMVANSFGCQVAVGLADRHPELVNRLVLTGPIVEPARRNPLTVCARTVLDYLREPVSLLLVELPNILSVGPRRALFTFRVMVAEPIERRLPTVPMPSLVVRGANDMIVSQSWVEQVAALLPAGQPAVISGATHAVNYNSPVLLAGAIRQFASVSDGEVVLTKFDGR
jgi:pimeloyl-ACP methyl ester carboxylesterase